MKGEEETEGDKKQSFPLNRVAVQAARLAAPVQHLPTPWLRVGATRLENEDRGNPVRRIGFRVGKAI